MLFAVWCASAENLRFIQRALERDFICPLKTNRQVALSLEEKLQGRYHRVDTSELAENGLRAIYLEGVDFPLLLAKQVFTHQDGSTGSLYLVSSATTRAFHDLTTNYHRRWQVECYHKALKQNVALEKAPTQTETTQTNHFFAALGGFIKLERLRVETKLNHFALKSKLYLNALHSAFFALRQLSPPQLAA